jgi:hypothetical protein
MNYLSLGQPRGADETFLDEMKVIKEDLASSL